MTGIPINAGDQLAELLDGLLLNVGKSRMKQLVDGAFHERTGAAIPCGMDHDPPEILVGGSVIDNPPGLAGETETDSPTLAEDRGRADALEAHGN
jgi:hypothetical protein